MMKSRTLFALLGSVALSAAMPTSANAAVSLELGLLIDGSGSIGLSNFNLQKNAYVNALGDLSVLPTDGTVAIGVYLFAGSTTTIFSMAAITSGNIASLISAVNGMSYTGGGTPTDAAVNLATADIFGNSIVSARQILDISTDGVPNSQSAYNTAKAAALAAGIDQINCVGIGAGADCSLVTGGTGAFSVNATTFDDFETALKRKITREVTGGAVPEPSTWAMMIGGFGLVGAAMRRRRYNLKVSFV